MKKLFLFPICFLLTQPVQAVQNDYNYAIKYCDLINSIAGFAATTRMGTVSAEDVIEHFTDIENEEFNSIGTDVITELVEEAYTLPIQFDEDEQRQVIVEFADRKTKECLDQTFKAEQK